IHLARNTELLRRLTTQDVTPPLVSQQTRGAASFADAARKDSTGIAALQGARDKPGSQNGHTRGNEPVQSYPTASTINRPSRQMTEGTAATDADGFTLVQRKRRVKPSSGSCTN
ncbi:hypothetical protein HPB47_002918, partial [Ixodes persulcatus]